MPDARQSIGRVFGCFPRAVGGVGSSILGIGNPPPVIKHPLRMAEELAEIDIIARGVVPSLGSELQKFYP